jgi:hypothetical protein
MASTLSGTGNSAGSGRARLSCTCSCSGDDCSSSLSTLGPPTFLPSRTKGRVKRAHRVEGLPASPGDQLLVTAASWVTPHT